MVQNIEFKKVKCNFQMKFYNDVKNIKKNPKLLVPADKTNKLYKHTTEEYNKLLIENISRMYKKTTMSAINSINTEAKAIAKSETGIVSKLYIDQINKSIREKLNVNQWRNIQAVITWFKNIKSKSSSSFIKFDIVDFYPSISKDLLLKVINFAKSITSIQDKFIETISYSCKALLFNKNDVWVKKDNPGFDVTMDSYDGAEVCELVGLYILHILTKESGHNKIGLCRDDRLGCF